MVYWYSWIPIQMNNALEFFFFVWSFISSKCFTICSYSFLNQSIVFPPFSFLCIFVRIDIYVRNEESDKFGLFSFSLSCNRFKITDLTCYKNRKLGICYSRIHYSLQSNPCTPWIPWFPIEGPSNRYAKLLGV